MTTDLLKEGRGFYKNTGRLLISSLRQKEKEIHIMSKSVPKLLQEANEIKQALEKIDDRLPDGLKAADMESKMGAVESVVDELDAVNVERTRLVDVKGEKTGNLNDHIVQVRSAVKGIFGANSAEYDMVGGTRTSERKRPARNVEGAEKDTEGKG
ncbi:MAG: hypothetical protein D3916_15485 [Candidatus Electrothrix sp. MAN1_4]|nr:hypothetical protein [Candidatus Electrothrix sp. MAN1_4]